MTDTSHEAKNLAGRTHHVDAYVKSGEFVNTYIEIKGTFKRKNGHIGKAKWEWFHEVNKNSQLWTKDVLKKNGIM